MTELGKRCWDCEAAELDRQRREQEGRCILEDIDAAVDRALARVGLFPDHLAAKLERIPPKIRTALPPDISRDLHSGRIPARGFGLAGTVGAGKSQAMAALIASYARVRIKGNALKLGEEVVERLCSVRWVDWPDLCDWMRGNPQRAGEQLHLIAKAPLLVVDDIGRERRVRESYEGDYCAEALSLLLNRRYLHKLPTLWTTNLKRAELEDRYGSGTFSRLAGPNPMSQWIVAPDLRFAGA